MPARPSHRLDLVLVPGDPLATPVAAVEAWWRTQIGHGRLTTSGQPGPAAAELVDGGFVRLRLDHPAGITLYGNRQGGFRVRCPACGANLVPAFSSAWAGRVPGVIPDIACEACGHRGRLDALDTAPAIAFGSLALVFADAGAAHLQPAAWDALQPVLGAPHLVWVRT